MNKKERGNNMIDFDKLAKKINKLIIKELVLYDTDDLETIIIYLLVNHICTSKDSVDNLIKRLETLIIEQKTD